MSTNSTSQPASDGRGGMCCCLLFLALPVVWLLCAPLLPDRVAWLPYGLAAVIWNGTDGQGGISHLLG
ncbi:hypothetical protein FCH28_24770 [Streptomyces piniterrae]|uniref:Uncharacterized protein n=1 Tax=Streptomyces piniterrae TaxID=2571125 RepID=A0A4U0N7I1_9ACTN|nr:hypothetical protein [Streptomyces piniterrae]TJZ49516.1 hypothetical protein FCH28_24770 [Streptomyces piniterrae]